MSILLSVAAVGAYVVREIAPNVLPPMLAEALVLLALVYSIIATAIQSGPPKATSSSKQVLEVPAQPATPADVLNAHFLGDSHVLDERDKKTPDDWVKRHPDLVRLTGR